VKINVTTNNIWGGYLRNASSRKKMIIDLSINNKISSYISYITIYIYINNYKLLFFSFIALSLTIIIIFCFLVALSM